MSEEGSGGSPLPPRRRIKKVMVLSSSSGEESDDSGGPRLPRNRKLRVVSDEEESDSSGSSVVQAGVRRKRALPKLRDSDDSDTSGWATDHSASKAAPAPAKGASGFASDSSEGNSDKCSICLMRFTNQEVGIPQNCEHVFCVDCITEWSKNVNTCPVDRISFDNIIVRACLGGRVLRTELVKVVERRPSVDLLVIEDPTACEICGSIDNEDSMLLCDACDLGFHMYCLTPALVEIPLDQWFCPACAADGAGEDFVYLSEVEDLLAEVADESPPNGPRPAPLRATRSVLAPARRSNRNRSNRSEPSTSTAADDLPTTSRGIRRSTTATTRRRKPTRRRRRTRTVIIEYEIQDGGKFPITKRVTKRVKRRRTKKRQPRTAARRAHVRASVRAILTRGATCTEGDQIDVMRGRAGIPALRLFGARDELEYFSDDEGGGDGPSVAVRAHRPTSEVLHAYRQARRKMITIPSPPHASAAPDLLSDILNSQTLLHSKRAKTTLKSDGRLDITLKADKLDLTKKSDDAAKKAPGYGGGGRSGGWGGGYRGNYHRQQGVNSFRDYNSSGPPRPDNDQPYRDNSRDEETFGDSNFQRRPFGPPDRPPFDRNRRPNDRDQNFQRNDRDHNFQRHDQNRPGLVHFATPEPPRPERPPTARHSFGGFDNPVDMRLGQESSPLSRRPGNSFGPLPEPPSFKFGPVPEAEKDEDEDLVIDTEKYDPTEPTNDDEDDNGNASASASSPSISRPENIPTPPLPPSALLSALDASNISLPSTVLDTAVRQVLREHRDLMAPTSRNKSDEDSDGDCPNFSIYSATSFHIANSSEVNNEQSAIRESPAVPAVLDEDIPFPEPDSPDVANVENAAPAPLSANVKSSATPSKVVDLPKKDAEEEYKEKVSKRCPITTNTRNPIKIKLNATSLIKRVSLYDEEDISTEIETSEIVEKPVTPEKVAKSPEIISEYSEKQKEASPEPSPEHTNQDELDDTYTLTPERVDASPKTIQEEKDEPDENDENEDNYFEEVTRDDKSDNEDHSEEELDNSKESKDKTEETIEKMTESISETEDERSYTPCLDENKSKDNSYETEKHKALDGLDTEMISEDEGNEMFSDNEQASEKATSEISRRSPSPTPPRVFGGEDGEIVDGNKENKEDSSSDRGKKKKKKDSKKEGKEKKSKKKGDVVFKKVKGKERNYRERDKEDKGKKKDKRDSSSEKERQKKKREKRKELERYDVRAVVSEKRKKLKDQFGRDISPQKSDSVTSPPRLSTSPVRRSQSPPRRSVSRARKSLSRGRRSISRGRRSLSRVRRSLSRPRRSVSRVRRSPSPRIRRSHSRVAVSPPRRRSPRRSMSPRRRLSRSRRRSVTPVRRKSPLRLRQHSPSLPPPRRRSLSVSPVRRRRKSPSLRRRSESRGRRKKHRSASPKPKKKKKRARSGSKARRRSPRAKSPKKKRARKSISPAPIADTQWSPGVDSRLLSPRTPPPEPPAEQPPRRRRRREDRSRHKRREVAPPSKEVFTSGDNILVSVSFKDQETNGEIENRRKRRTERREKRRRRLNTGANPVTEQTKPVAIIDLERSPFREITPSPKNVIVLSDSDHNDKENDNRNVQQEKSAPEPVKESFPVSVGVGPKTPPEPIQFTIPAKPQAPRLPNPLRDDEPGSEQNAGEESAPQSPDAYDPFEPTRSPSPLPAASVAPTPAIGTTVAVARQPMTLDAAQRTNLSADDVIDTAPISPIEKVMALLQSTRDISPDPPPAVSGPGDSLPPPAAPAPPVPAAPPIRIVLPSPTRAQSKLLATKPSPIKSNPIKPLQATSISKLPMPPRRADSDMGADSPYSPGSSDFGDLFEPPSAGGGGGNRKKDAFDSLFGSAPRRRHKSAAAKVPVKLSKKKGKSKMQVGVKIDEDNLKILDELPSSAVEMQVKSKFLKKLNRQERVVEEVKLVLKPHYNKKRVTKEEYKQIMRRAVPKICHNKSGEINPSKIQALVEAYVKKVRKKHKLGLA